MRKATATGWRNLLVALAGAAALHADPLAAAAPAHGGIVSGSGVPAEKVLPIPAAARKLRLDVPGNISVRIEPKGRPRVSIRFDRNLVDLVTVASSGDSVRIGMSASFESRLGLRIDVVLNAMAALSANGSADVSVDRLDEPQLLIESPGSGNVSASGRAGRLVVRVSGSGEVSAERLAADTCEVSSSGSGNIGLRCSDSVAGELSGAGDLSIAGGPKRRSVRADGAGEVNYR